jgi:hypothetical protein
MCHVFIIVLSITFHYCDHHDPEAFITSESDTSVEAGQLCLDFQAMAIRTINHQ